MSNTSEQTVEDTLNYVHYTLLKQGYDPINQITGYLVTGKPTYITNYLSARIQLLKLDRDEIIRYLVNKHFGGKQNAGDA